MRRLLAILFLLLAASAPAATVQIIRGTINVTNAPTTNSQALGVSFVAGATARVWTNNPAGNPAIYIQTNLTIAGSATNLWDHLSAAPIYPSYGIAPKVSLASNAVTIISSPGGGLTITVTGFWANVTYSTQTIAEPMTMLTRVPLTVEAATNQTWIASKLAQGINDLSTNAFKTNAAAMSNYVSVGSVAQTYGNKTITNGVLDGTRASNILAFVGTIFRITNGYSTNLTLDLPITTNLVNYGTAISSPGSAAGAEELGSGSTATGVNSLAVGKTATASATSAMAIGNAANASGQYSSVLGYGGSAAGFQGIAIGPLATASGSNSIVIGAAGDAQTYANSIVIAPTGGLATDTNQITLGRATGLDRVLIPGQLLVSGSQSNTTFTGTNQWKGDIAYPWYDLASLAAGNNLAVPLGTNRQVMLSGNGAAATIVGFTGGRDGKPIRLFNKSLYNITLAQNTSDPTPENRIVANLAGDYAYGPASIIDIVWLPSDSRWHFHVSSTTVTNSLATNSATFTITTNDFALNTYVTNVAQRAYVSASILLTSAVATSAKVALYVDQDGDGTFEQTGIAVQAGAGSIVAEINQLGAYLQPSARFMFTNLSTGTATATVNGNGCQWVKQ